MATRAPHDLATVGEFRGMGAEARRNDNEQAYATTRQVITSVNNTNSALGGTEISLQQVQQEVAASHTEPATVPFSAASYGSLGARLNVLLSRVATLCLRQVSAGTGLTGGGDLTADRTLAVSYGTAAGTAAQGNDARLSDARTPTGAAGGSLSGTYPNPAISFPPAVNVVTALPTASGATRGQFYLLTAAGAQDVLYVGVNNSSGVAHFAPVIVGALV